ncbi:hypothetical protein M9H77_35103 [Catharanthus roseus]|uniref:Uncharacterized protein n=1 Tax=Catharanthus roseus TaxID=4058 RepID=A0ACB9ZNC6_CATRO|nr:hypothetical protein M9H77_35103 [Catharanthus roseus]
MIKDEEVVLQLINGTWNKLLNEIDEAEYYKRLDDLKTKWLSNFLHYLFKTWLNPLSHKLIRVWTSKVLHFGVETTNRVESEYSVLKIWLSIFHGDLDIVFLNIDSVIEGQIAEIKSILDNNISHLALKKIWVELKRAPEIIVDPKNKYIHYLRTSHKIGGAHLVSQDKDMDVEMHDLAFLLDQISTRVISKVREMHRLAKEAFKSGFAFKS